MSEELASRALREEIRTCKFDGITSAKAMGFVQANMAVVPEKYAFDFLLFCQRNPKPCPLLEVVGPGSVEPVRVAPGADLRKDLPRYRIFRDGVMTGEKTNVEGIWTDDMVAFLLGCSFSFEKPLMDAGLEVRNITDGVNVPMYTTNIPCREAGPFNGPIVVSMRPFTPEGAIQATLITGALPEVHGAPIHVGNPAAIGVSDINVPSYGIPANIHEGEVPVFWACGVTPQEILLNAKLPLAITHSPGHMFVTDLREEEIKMFREKVR